MERLKIALVGYLNTLPFEYGLKKMMHSYDMELYLENPARCAVLFDSAEADISLVPVGALVDRDDYKIVSDYCIGCHGPVRTVCLFANTPLGECDKVYLDTHSRTSALLTRVLFENYWKQDVSFIQAEVSELNSLSDGEAVLMIGDKVFENENHFSYKYDLGQIWHDFTGLPFAFAVWVSKKDTTVRDKILDPFLKKGMEKIPELITSHAKKSNLTEKDIDAYINENLNFILDPPKREAIDKFMHLAKALPVAMI